MQMVDPRAAMTGAQLIQHYAAIRKKLFYVPPKKIVMPKPQTRIDPDNRGKRPLWCLKDISFDEHVKIWNKFNKPAKKENSEKYNIHDTPMWKLAPTHFNNHVVQFLQKKLREESDGEYGNTEEKKPVNVIIAEVLEFFDGITTQDVNGHRRTSRLILPRQLCMWEVKTQRFDLSYPEIGRRMGGKDHTSVMHAVKKIDAMKERGELDWYFSARGC